MYILADEKPGFIDGIQLTPYIAYKAISDFSDILEEISNGNIKTGSGIPFPVDIDIDKAENYIESNMNEFQMSTNSIPFI